MARKIGSRIKFIRKKYGLTMSEFAGMIGVSAGNVGDWESDKKKTIPSARALIKISQKFDVSLDWLMMGKEVSTHDKEKSIESMWECELNEKLDNLSADDKKFLQDFLHLYMEYRKKNAHEE